MNKTLKEAYGTFLNGILNVSCIYLGFIVIQFSDFVPLMFIGGLVLIKGVVEFLGQIYDMYKKLREEAKKYE